VCLIITIRLSECDAARAREIAAGSTSPDTIAVAPVRRFFRRATRDLNISERRQGCACSMLHEDADWDSSAWRMRPEVLPQLASALAKIRDHSSEPFTFETLWVGDDVYYEREVPFDELRGIIESGQIGSHTRYTVT
jgi:hypothetical protein